MTFLIPFCDLFACRKPERQGSSSPAKEHLIMTIATDTQAQLDRLSSVSAEIDAYTAAQVQAATATLAQDHADEVAALTAQIDALQAKLVPAPV